MANPQTALSTLHGISIGSLITGAGVWTAVATLIGIILRSRVPMRKMRIDADEKLIDTLSKRVDKLEADLAGQRTTYEAKIDLERAEHSRDNALLRHRMNNLDQCLTMLLALIESDPDKAQAAAARVREMRTRQEMAEAAEKGAASGAKIEAILPVIKPA